MKDKTALPPKQQRFVDEYLIDLNATQAAIRAGYSAKSAFVQASRLLSNAKVQAALQVGQQDRAKRTAITADRVLRELAVLGLSDMRNYLRFGDDGEATLDWSSMPEEATKAIAEITQEEYMDGKGEDARQVRRTKFRLHDKNRALEMIAKHIGLLVERHEHTGKDGGPIEIMTLSEAIKKAAEADEKKEPAG